MTYKHKITGEYYYNSKFEALNGRVNMIFNAFKPDLDPIVVTIKDENVEETVVSSIDNKKVEQEVYKIFDEIELKPISSVKKCFIVKMKCPLCGSKIIQKGNIYLTDPARYEHICTNKNCGFKYCTTRFYAGQELLGNLDEDVNRIISEGTTEEQDNLLKLSENKNGDRN